ncbi:hypothetical protein ACN6K5_003546 [Streptomyces violaceoruber]|uniref:hypothetical protein n=1 Tax=Streptomyces violaceoruber TaxID=1935 RepID=UPI00403C1884
MSSLRPDFAAHASLEAIRAQYERAQAQADLWSDRARDLFLLLCQRETQTRTKETSPCPTSRP